MVATAECGAFEEKNFEGKENELNKIESKVDNILDEVEEEGGGEETLNTINYYLGNCFCFLCRGERDEIEREKLLRNGGGGGDDQRGER